MMQLVTDWPASLLRASAFLTGAGLLTLMLLRWP